MDAESGSVHLVVATAANVNDAITAGAWRGGRQNCDQIGLTSGDA